MSGQSSIKSSMPQFFLILLIFKIVHLLLKQSFYNKAIAKLDFQLALCSFIWTAIILQGKYSKSFEFVVFWMIVSTPLAFKLVSIFIEYREKKYFTYFLQNAHSIDWKNDVSSTTFDFYCRYLWNQMLKSDEESMLLNQDSIYYELIIFWHTEACQKRPFCYCQEVSEVKPFIQYSQQKINRYQRKQITQFVNQITYYIDQTIFNQRILIQFGVLYCVKIIRIFSSTQLSYQQMKQYYFKRINFVYQNINKQIAKNNLVKEYLLDNQIRRRFMIDYIHQIFHHFLSHQKTLNSVHFTYFYFLKECSKNEPLLNIKLYEYYKRFSKEMSIQNVSMIEYLIAQQKQLSSSFDIHSVIQFDDKLSTIRQQLVSTLEMKQQFLKTISQDYILLPELEKNGISLCQQRDQLHKKFKSLYLINPENTQLSFLISNFLCCLSFDDSKDIFALKAKRYKEDKAVKAAFQKDTSVIFLSLLKEEFAIIKNVSNSFLPQFNFEKKEVLGKNINTLMPRCIGVLHDKILSTYIDRGFFQLQKINRLMPLFAMNRQGFLVPVNIQVQITLAGFDEIGVSGLLQTQKEGQNQYLALVDLINDNLVQGCTQKLFTNLFEEYLEKKEDVKNIHLTQAIPLLPYITKNNMLQDHKNNDHQLESSGFQYQNQGVQIIKSEKIETIAFFPKGKKNGIQRLFLKSMDIDQMIRNGQLSLLTNDIYIISFKTQVTVDEYLNLGKITIKQFQKIDQLENQMQCIKLLFLEQVKQYCPHLNYTDQDIQTFFFVQNWQSTINQKVNQVIDKYSHHHQSSSSQFPESGTVTSFKKNIQNKIEEIQEEKEEGFNTSQMKENQMMSYRHNLYYDGGENNKEELLMSMHRQIGSTDNLFSQDNSKIKKKNSSLRNIMVPHSSDNLSSHKLFDHTQLNNQLTNTHRYQKENENTHAISQTSLQSPRILSTQENQNQQNIQQKWDSKITNSQFFNNYSKKQSQEITTNISNQTNKKVHSKDSTSHNKENKTQQNAIHQLQFVHEQSVSSSRNSQYNTQKKMIKNAFVHTDTNRIFKIIQIMAGFSLIIVGLVIIIFYLQLDHKFELQKTDFYYIPWGMNLRVSVSRIIKNHVFEKFVDIDDFIFPSPKDVLKKKFHNEKQENYQYYKGQILEIVNEKVTDIFLLTHLTTSIMEIRMYETDTIFKSVTTSTQHALDVYGQMQFELAYKDYTTDKQKDKKVLLNIFNNFLLTIKELAAIQSMQENNIGYLYDKISSIVIMLLLIICIISFLFVVAILPVFSYAQQKKQQVFQLFSTIDPERLKQMHKTILISILTLNQDNNKLMKSQHFINAIQAQGAMQIKESLLVNKKKQISVCSVFPMFSLRLIFKLTIIYIIITVYPVVNFILTDTLTSQSNNNQNLQGLVQIAKAQISSNIATFALCTHSDLGLSDDKEYFEKYQTRFLSIMKTNAKVFSDFQNAIQEQQSKKRYNQNDFDDFFFQIITKNSCEALINNQKYFNSTILNQDTCNQVHKGVLKEGLLSSINIFAMFFQDVYDINQIKDDQTRYKALVELFQRQDLLSINNLYELIYEFLVGLTKFIVKNNTEFFDLLNSIQSILMAYQFIVLVLVYKFGLMSFFDKIVFKLQQAKDVLTVFEITYLIENSYILNYLMKQ